MVTTSLLLDKIKFQSKKLQALCKKHFNALKSDYEVRQFEDDSGDSEEEGTPANEYKKHLLNFNELIEKGMKGRKLQDKTNKSVNDSRTFDHYRHKFGILSPGISKEQDNISNKTQDSIYEYNEEKWNKYFNNTDDNQELPLNLDEKIVIPFISWSTIHELSIY